MQDRNVARAAIWLYVYACPPALIFAALFALATSRYAPELHATIGQAAAQKTPSWFPMLIFNPLVESLLLAGVLKLSVRLGAGSLSFVVTAVAIAALHSLANPTWGLTVFSLFLIQSYAFLHTYRSGFWRAYLVISLAHALHNAVVLAGLSFL